MGVHGSKEGSGDPFATPFFANLFGAGDSDGRHESPSITKPSQQPPPQQNGGDILSCPFFAAIFGLDDGNPQTPSPSNFGTELHSSKTSSNSGIMMSCPFFADFFGFGEEEEVSVAQTFGPKIAENESVPHAYTPLALHQTIGLSAAASAVGASLTFPMDKVKTRTIMHAGETKGIASMGRSIVQKEGTRALFRGLLPQLAGTLPEKSVKFVVFNTCMNELHAGKSSVSWARVWEQEAFCGALAGIAQVLVNTPYEVVKTKMQLQRIGCVSRGKQPGPFAVAYSLGLRGLYTGVGCMIVRDSLFNAIFFSSFGCLKRYSAGPGGDPAALHPLELVVLGMAAAVIPTTLTHPLEVLKTHAHNHAGTTACSSPLTAFRGVVSKNGVFGLFRGLAPRLAVVAPLFGVALCTFEVLQRALFPETVRREAQKQD